MFGHVPRTGASRGSLTAVTASRTWSSLPITWPSGCLCSHHLEQPRRLHRDQGERTPRPSRSIRARSVSTRRCSGPAIRVRPMECRRDGAVRADAGL